MALKVSVKVPNQLRYNVNEIGGADDVQIRDGCLVVYTIERKWSGCQRGCRIWSPGQWERCFTWDDPSI